MYGETMKELKVGDEIVLTNGDTGHVSCVLDGGYEYLMDRTGLYHHSYTDGSAVMFDPPVDVKKTEILLAEEERQYRRLTNILKAFEGQPFTAELRDKMAEKAAGYFTTEEIQSLHVGVILDSASRIKD